MKKKFPKEWEVVVSDFLQEAFNFGVQRRAGSSLKHREEIIDRMFATMDAAGMLKDVPELLEFNWCKEHNCKQHDESIARCDLTYKYLFGGGAGELKLCSFVKLREVEE